MKLIYIKGDFMPILYCRIGYMKYYKGQQIGVDEIRDGGSYNEKNIGHEVYNFENYDGKYYGYVQPDGPNNDDKSSNNLGIYNLGASKKDEYIDGVTVVWRALKSTNKTVIVGWYENARVYKSMQKVPEDVLDKRENKSKCEFNIYAEKAIIVPQEKRDFIINGRGHNVWYNSDNEELPNGKYLNDEVLEYIKNYDSERNDFISKISSDNIEGKEKDVLVKARVNQSVFRENLLKKYNNQCCLCKLSIPDLLISSHIKPWSVSDSNEKVDVNNGLLLCANHDKLFDKGLISFDENGNIIISSKLSNMDKILSNIQNDNKIELDYNINNYMKYHRRYIFKK